MYGIVNLAIIYEPYYTQANFYRLSGIPPKIDTPDIVLLTLIRDMRVFKYIIQSYVLKESHINIVIGESVTSPTLTMKI